MAKKRDLDRHTLPERLREFISHLRPSLHAQLPDASVYVTGSYARGDWIDDSDIDLIVVSKKFRRMDIGKRYQFIKALSPPGFSLEVQAYTPAEFRAAKGRSIILQDMMQYARQIA